MDCVPEPLLRNYISSVRVINITQSRWRFLQAVSQLGGFVAQVTDGSLAVLLLVSRGSGVAIGLLFFEHVIDDPREFVGRGRCGLGY